METCQNGHSEDEGKIHAGKTQNISSLLGPNQTKKALRSTENTETYKRSGTHKCKQNTICLTYSFDLIVNDTSENVVVQAKMNNGIDRDEVHASKENSNLHPQHSLRGKHLLS